MKARVTAATFAVILLSACSGISVSQDFSPDVNFAAFQTWDWMPNPTQPIGDTRADNTIVDQRIRSAVEAGLQAKGFRKVTSGEPDFRVGYQITLNDRTDYQTVNDYWGGSWGYRGMYGGYAGPGMSTSRTTAVPYTQGTFILDLFDVASKELVWRGSAEGRLREYSSAEEKQERANKVVQKILEQFPPNR